jgi:hypothetical protein
MPGLTATNNRNAVAILRPRWTCAATISVYHDRPEPGVDRAGGGVVQRVKLKLLVSRHLPPMTGRGSGRNLPA